MDVVSTCPLRAASRAWQSVHGGAALTVVCKATYLLAPGESPLHPQQDPPNEDDAYWDDDPRRSLSAASDLAPFKPRADVVLVGSAFAPGGRPLRSIVTRLIVGDVDKAIEAFCDRAFRQTGELVEGLRVAQVPLRYERAAGGPGTWNPVGVRHDADPDAYGMIPVPNLQPPGVHLAYRGDFIEPAGFGPIAPSWPTRAQRLGPGAAGFTPSRWYERPLPQGLDPAFFNVAPPDQQVGELRSNERLVLENLLREAPRLVTSLPGWAPIAVVERAGGQRERLAMTADTLSIDTSLGTCSMVWRGWVRLSHPEETGRVVVSIETPSAADRKGRRAPIEAKATLPASPTAGRGPAMPFAASMEDPKTPFQGTPPPPRRGAGGTWPASQHAARSPFASESAAHDVLATSPEPPVAARRPATPFTSPADAPAPIDTKATFPASPMAAQRPATPFVSPWLAPQRPAEPATPPLPRPRPEGGGETLNEARGPTRHPLPFLSDPAQDADADESTRRIQLIPPEPVPMPAFVPMPALVPMAARPLMTLGHDPASAPIEPAPAAVEEDEGAPTDPPAEPEPGDFPIERCGALTAAIAMNRPETAELLEEDGLTPARWDAIAKHWDDAIRDERARGKTGLLKTFDAAYVASMEERRGAFQVEEYARLVVGAERGSVSSVVGDLGLPKGAPMRIERVWAARMMKDPALARRVRAAIAAERER